MRKYFKRLAALVLIPLVKWYLRKERLYSYKEIDIFVSPGVFHPGFFYSTKFILKYLNNVELSGRTVLELGCGSGLISIVAAKAGGLITASDLSRTAIQNTKRNALRNEVIIETVHSDLFDNIHGRFDVIIINPPYYPNDATDEPMLAWNCGRNFEYFVKLFSQLSNHISANSRVLMVLTKGCDRSSIFRIASNAGFKFELIAEKNVLFDEKDYLYEIKTSSSG